METKYSRKLRLSTKDRSDREESPHLGSDGESQTEWAIARLQAEATFQLAQLHSAAAEVSTNTSPAEKEEEDEEDYSAPPSTETESPTQTSNADCSTRIIGRYHCTSGNRHGRLTVTHQGIGFKQHLSLDRRWHLGYEEIKAMQKIVGSSTISSGDDLLFIDIHDREFRAAGLAARDEVFTQIVGYSKVQWQVTV